MAYLDNTTITVDAVLTKKGRERLGQGRDAFRITKFAVSDDEIDSMQKQMDAEPDPTEDEEL